MSTIVTRAGKGSALTHTEVDANFTNLNTDKVEAAQSVTLTNKTIALGSNTVSGTTAQFNTALTDGDFATLAGSETLTNKTISGSSNTLSNIGNSSLTNSSVTIGSTSVSLGSTATTVSGLTLSSPTVNTPTLSGGTINNASVGATTPSSGAFTTLSATGVTTVQAGTAAAPAITTSGDTNTGIFSPSADTWAVATGGTEALRVDSARNMGLGVTPSAWKSNWKAIDVAARTAYASGSIGQPVIGYNGYVNSSNQWIYKETAKASQYAMDEAHYWYIAPSGTAGNAITFTQAMTLDASGNLLVGTTSWDYAGNNGVQFRASGSNNSSLFLETASATIKGFVASDPTASRVGLGSLTNHPVVFISNNAERGRFTSGGYFKASDNGTYAGATGLYHEFKQSAQDYTLITWGTNASLTSSIQEVYASRSATSAYTFINVYSSVGGTSDREFQLRGDGNAYADGTWNNNGADYAEYFESSTGAALTLGATVVLDGNKVREATDQDPASAIMGVVRPKEPSKASMVVGNTAWNKWANKYLTDDFDRYIMEDHDVVEWEETITNEDGKTSTKQHSYESHRIPAGVTVPDDAVVKTHDDKGNKFQHYKLNPAWNPDAEYVNRENRPEWIIVGLVGQVKILKGQPVNDRWIKMRDVSKTVEEWMIR